MGNNEAWGILLTILAIVSVRFQILTQSTLWLVIASQVRLSPLISTAGPFGASKWHTLEIEGEHDTQSPYFLGASIWGEEINNKQANKNRSSHIVVHALEEKNTEGWD